jgi:hypothetical protein
MTTLDNREVAIVLAALRTLRIAIGTNLVHYSEPTQAQVIELALAITTTAVDPAEIDDLADRLTSI